MDGHPFDSLPGNRDKGTVLDAVYLYHALSGQSYTLQVGAIMAWGLIRTEKTNNVELLLEILCYPVELGANNIILFKLGCCTDDR